MLSETDDLEVLSDADVSCIQQSFPALVTLGMNRTGLKNWQEVETLRHFPSLTDVRLKAIPFLEVRGQCEIKFFLSSVGYFHFRDVKLAPN